MLRDPCRLNDKLTLFFELHQARHICGSHFLKENIQRFLDLINGTL